MEDKTHRDVKGLCDAEGGEALEGAVDVCRPDLRLHAPRSQRRSRSLAITAATAVAAVAARTPPGTSRDRETFTSACTFAFAFFAFFAFFASFAAFAFLAAKPVVVQLLQQTEEAALLVHAPVAAVAAQPVVEEPTQQAQALPACNRTEVGGGLARTGSLGSSLAAKLGVKLRVVRRKVWQIYVLELQKRGDGRAAVERWGFNGVRRVC
jgi:hypothetical protein